MMDATIRAQAEQLLAACREMHQKGELPDKAYYKCVVCVAFEYLLGQETDEGMTVLFLCPPSYFKNEMEAQMREDPAFAKIGQLVYDILEAKGLLDLSSDLKPTQPMATC
jgi:hypothetical protein